MNKTVWSALTLALLATSLHPQTEPAKLPAEAKSLLPAQGEILDAASADLNGDGVPDYVVVTEAKGNATPDADPTRTVFVIEQEPAGKYKIAARNNHAVMAKSDGGGMGDPFDAVTADKKAFTISHLGGRREKWTLHYIFRFSPPDDDWFLSGVDAGGDAKPQKFRFPDDFGKIAFQDFNTDKWQGRGAGYQKSAKSQPPIPQ